jgi:hypothetical protein
MEPAIRKPPVPDLQWSVVVPRTGGFRGADLTPYLRRSRYLTTDTDAIPDDPAALAASIPASWWVPGYGGWDQATILQFTAKGDAGNLANHVDLNVTRLNRGQLLALTHRPGGVAPLRGRSTSLRSHSRRRPAIRSPTRTWPSWSPRPRPPPGKARRQVMPSWSARSGTQSPTLARVARRRSGRTPEMSQLCSRAAG